MNDRKIQLQERMRELRRTFHVRTREDAAEIIALVREVESPLIDDHRGKLHRLRDMSHRICGGGGLFDAEEIGRAGCELEVTLEALLREFSADGWRLMHQAAQRLHALVSRPQEIE